MLMNLEREGVRAMALFSAAKQSVSSALPEVFSFALQFELRR